MEQRDLFWTLYLSERDFIKHHETQRTTASNIIAAIAAGLIVGSGSATTDPSVKVAIALMLMVIGLFGYFFCGKLTALLKLHGSRSYEYLKLLDADIGDSKISEIRKKADSDSKQEFRFFSKLRLHKIWSAFHLFIFFVGLTLLWVHGGGSLVEFLYHRFIT